MTTEHEADVLLRRTYADLDQRRTDLDQRRAERAALGITEPKKREVRRAIRQRRGRTHDRAGRPL